jgi:transcriptional regulator with XRE-family HTH domain
MPSKANANTFRDHSSAVIHPLHRFWDFRFAMAATDSADARICWVRVNLMRVKRYLAIGSRFDMSMLAVLDSQTQRGSGFCHLMPPWCIDPALGSRGSLPRSSNLGALLVEMPTIVSIAYRMVLADDRSSSGISDLDVLLDGLAAGDNVVWVGDDPAIHRVVESAFLTSGSQGPRIVVHLSKDRAEPPIVGVEEIDARSGRPFSDPTVLERTIVDRGSAFGARIVVRDLDTLVRRLGPERALTFFTRTCPRLFDLGAIAYWRASRAGSGRILGPVQRVTQCVLDHTGARLRVLKAESRPGAVGRIFDLRITGEGIEFDEVRALGRLAENLRRLRVERSLTQTEIARLAGVSPSAVSQAESGLRGLGLDTLLTLSEALGVTLDALLHQSRETGYLLARRDRRPPRRGIVALLDEPTAGLRAYLVTLGPEESGGPSTVHKGAELILVGNGLVQIELANEAPVMRAGDALLVTRDAIGGWRNLLPEPARLFWILRD